MKLNDKAYNLLKWLAQIFLPALGVLYFSMSDLWSLPKPLEVVSTFAAVGTFIGVLLGISSASYKKTNEPHAGYIQQVGVDPNTGHPDLSLTLTKMPSDLMGKKTITLQVDNPPVEVRAAAHPEPGQV